MPPAIELPQTGVQIFPLVLNPYKKLPEYVPASEAAAPEFGPPTLPPVMKNICSPRLVKLNVPCIEGCGLLHAQLEGSGENIDGKPELLTLTVTIVPFNKVVFVLTNRIQPSEIPQPFGVPHF